MLTITVFLISFCKTGELPAIMVMAGTSCIDIGTAMFYMFFISFLMSNYFSNKRDYVVNILSVKKEKKNDQGTS